MQVYQILYNSRVSVRHAVLERPWKFAPAQITITTSGVKSVLVECHVCIPNNLLLAIINMKCSVTFKTGNKMKTISLEWPKIVSGWILISFRGYVTLLGICVQLSAVQTPFQLSSDHGDGSDNAAKQ